MPMASPGTGNKFVSDQRNAAWRHRGGRGMTGEFHGLFKSRFDFLVAVGRDLPFSFPR